MKKERMISVVLALCLLLGTISVNAEEQTRTISSEKENIQIFPENVQHPGEIVEIHVNENEGIQGLQYKYVWEKDNWNSWGVIKDFSDATSVQWIFDAVGDYKIYIDVKDEEGEISTQICDYKIRTNIWSYEDIETDLPSPQEKYTVPIKVTANVSGETDTLQYKYVWEKDNWKSWGIIKDFGVEQSADWYPKEAGTYTIYVDVKDDDANIVTKTMEYVIESVTWNIEGITVEPQEVQKKGETISLNAQVTGNTDGLQYKYVWEKDNWKEWGVIRDFAESSSVVWETPERAGTYHIYADVKDRDGEIRSVSIPYRLVTQIWQHDGVNINGGEPQQVYRNILLEAKVSGETENLQYKFVWEKDNWKEWGVIRQFENLPKATWYPKEAGTYHIYSDVKDEDGRIQTFIEEYEVMEAPWKIDEIQVEAEGSYFVGDSTEVVVKASGNSEGLKYKFVVTYGDDWSDWKVLQDFEENNSVVVDLKKAGTCTIYVDVMDQEGEIFDAVTKKIVAHRYLNAVAFPTKVSLGKSILLSPNLTDQVKGAEYKFVWEKNNWSEWGIIRDFSPESSVEWTPPEELGTYNIYIDVRLNGIIQTKSADIQVVKAKNGWYYEDGYKFFYQDNVKVEDVRNIIGVQPSYEIRVNKQMSCVTVYAKDGGNGYIIPVVAFACSPGKDTPTGTFYTQNKYRWHHLYGADGQFCTRITGHVLFHSPPYTSFDNHTLWPKEYNRLGTWASAGCVRLRSGDAKWIYDNCSLQTKVVIYNSSVAGPFTKPVYEKIPLSQTWDPTDPYA